MLFRSGLDVGTSSTKSVVVERSSLQIRGTGQTSYSKRGECSDDGYAELDARSIIFECLTSLQDLKLEELPIYSVAVCGQMHGVVLWSKG